MDKNQQIINNKNNPTMKKRITFLMAAFTLLAFLAIPMGVWGQTRVEEVYSTCLFGSDYNSQSVGSYTATWTATNGDYTWTIVNGNNNNNAWSYVKFGRKNNASVGEIKTKEAYEQAITKVDLTIDAITANNVNSIKLYASTDNDTWTEVGSFAKSSGLQTVTVASPAADQYYKIEFDCTSGSSNGLVTVSKVEYYYNTSGASSPTISADNVELTYDATSGAIEYTVNNPVQGGELTAATNAEWITIGTVGETVPFTCTVNEDGAAREAVVTLTYTYGEQAINQAVTVTQAGNPNTLDNISDITATGAYAVQGTIVAMSQRGFIVGDGTGYVYYYNTNYDQSAYAIGDMVKLAGNVVVYGGVFEFNNSTTVTPANSSNYVAEEPTVITGEEMDARVASTTPAQLSNYVQYEGTLSINNNHYNITNIAGATTAIGSISYPLDTEFADLDGHQVKVSGYYVGISSSTYYNTMIGTIEEVTTTDPIITVTPATVEVDAEEHDGTLDLAYENLEISDMTDFDIQYYDAEGEETETPDWIEVLVAEQDPEIGEGYVVSYYMFENEGEARSAYFKVFAAGDEDFVYSNLVTVNQDAYVAPALDYAELPFEFNGGRDDIEGTDGLTAEGLGNDYNSAPKLRFDGTGDWLLLHFEGVPGKLAFDIKGNSFSEGTFTVQTSEDGETYTDFATYTELGATEHEVFNNLGEDVRYIKWIYTEKVNGNVALGNIVLLQYTEPEEYSLTIDNPENVTITASYGTDGVLTNGESASILEGTEISLVANVTEGYVFEGFTVTDDEDNEISLTENDGVYSFHMPSSNVTVSATAVEDVPATPGTWVLTDLADLTENDVFVIVGTRTDETYGGNYAMPNDNGTSAPAAVAVTVVEGTLSGEPATNLQWNLGITDNGYIFYPNGTTETWLYCTNTNNGVRVGTNADNVFTMSENGYLHNTATGRYIGIYNSQDWRCYTSEGGNIANQTFAFYKKVETLPANSIVIEGYGESEGGYYLIASPFTVSPEDVQGMTEGEYDLYSFDEAEENEWRNYKAGAFTNLEPGKGYLYAHSTTVTLTFDGEAYNDEPIVLKKTAGGDFPGWNLVGNPYTETAYIDRDFYVMNPETGGEIITGEGNEIAPMQGFFVIADQDGEELEISTEPTEEGSKIVMNVNSNRGNIIDRAVVRFGEGRQLPKFMLNEDNTKLYIAKGEEEYAVARNEAKGEMNLNFEAAEDGTYTLDFTVVNVELDQFLLIDNKTGVSIDLLSSSSYTFEANTTDNASRFRVVFGITTTVSEENANTFAFYNNGNLILNNEGSAILNVVDVLGRIISSYNINGSESIHINAQAGVYMLQLVQGDKIQTQKIVVE